MPLWLKIVISIILFVIALAFAAFGLGSAILSDSNDPNSVWYFVVAFISFFGGIGVYAIRPPSAVLADPVSGRRHRVLQWAVVVLVIAILAYIAISLLTPYKI